MSRVSFRQTFSHLSALEILDGALTYPASDTATASVEPRLRIHMGFRFLRCPLGGEASLKHSGGHNSPSLWSEAFNASKHAPRARVSQHERESRTKRGKIVFHCYYIFTLPQPRCYVGALEPTCYVLLQNPDSPQAKLSLCASLL